MPRQPGSDRRLRALGSAFAAVTGCVAVGLVVGLQTNSDTWGVVAAGGLGLVSAIVGLIALVAQGEAKRLPEIFLGRSPRG